VLIKPPDLVIKFKIINNLKLTGGKIRMMLDHFVVCLTLSSPPGPLDREDCKESVSKI
jgi:hypothetical protein